MSDSSPKKLSTKQQRAAWLVALDEMTRAEIADHVGIAECTLYVWLKDEAFQLEVETNCRRLVRELVAPALARLRRTIKKGKPGEANKAIEIALKAAGWLAKEGAGDGGASGKEQPDSGLIVIPADSEDWASLGDPDVQ